MKDKTEDDCAYFEELIDKKLRGYKLNHIAPETEIDLGSVVRTVWAGRFWVLVSMLAFGVSGLLYSFSTPPKYKSFGVYAVAKNSVRGAIETPLGSIASIAGLNIGGGTGTSDLDEASKLVSSFPFLIDFIRKENLAPLLVAVKGWDKSADEIVWNEDIYDQQRGAWVKSGGNRWASDQLQLYREIESRLTFELDARTGLVTISFLHESPKAAYDIVKSVVGALNDHFQSRDVLSAKKNIAYLQDKIDETSVSEMRSVFYGMIEVQTKNLMLAEVGNEYLFREIVRPIIPEKPSGMSVVVVVGLSAAVGIVFAIFLVFVVSAISGAKSIAK